MIIYLIVSDKFINHENTDIHFMKEALKEAKKAFEKGEVPIGAIIVKDGEIVGSGHNEIERKKDVTAHGEITAIKRAEKKLESRRLSECTMYVTAEPCTMCAGAMVLARIKRLVTGAPSPKSGACYSLKNLLADNSLNHTVDLTKGIMEDECSRLLKDFFKELRATKLNYKSEEIEVGNNHK